MSSEFTVGLSGNQRNSSKVLKPPGGGSSNIFGFSGDYKPVDEQKKKSEMKPLEVAAVEPNFIVPTSIKKQVKRNPITGEEVEINQKENVDEESEKRVMRNPITGEEKMVNQKNVDNQTENRVLHDPITGKVMLFPEEGDDKEVIRNPITGEIVKVLPKQEEPVEEKPKKPLVTSIRVKNPPGGKSTFTF